MTFRTLAVLPALALAGVAVGLGSLWLERRTDITLPTPTGPFPVGRAIYDWADDVGLDSLAPAPGTKRELLVWVWYPAEAGASVPVDDYLPAPMRAAAGPGGLLKLVTRDLSRVHGHSMHEAAVSPVQRSYPVVILRAGASAPVWSYSTLAEDLASHGYVVVGFDAPWRTIAVTFPDGRAMKRLQKNNPELCESPDQQLQAGCANRMLSAWTSDIAFALDRLAQLNTSDASGRFTGRLDMTRVGVFGHSFGGATAAQFCHDDRRCTAGIDLDGQLFGSVVQAGIDRPFMLLLSDHGDSSDPETRQIKANLQAMYDHLPPQGRLYLAIRGGNHFFFSDDGALLKSHLVMGALRLLHSVRIDGRRQLAVTAWCVTSFFDAYLRGGGASRLTIPSPLYPEIQRVE